MDLSNYILQANELPLDRIVDDGGFTSIFRTIGCIGDSLSSGEFESTNPEMTQKGYHDYYEYSWGQYIARATGCQVYNFSRGGMTAAEYWRSFAEDNHYWDQEKLCQAYIIALGVNDLIYFKQDIGAVKDINLQNYDNNADSFAGYYGRIIQRIKAMQPKARFFLMTMPRGEDTAEIEALKTAQRSLLYSFTDIFDYTYVIDLYKYAPIYDAEFRQKFFLGGHMNPMGYILTAKMTMSYIDYLVRKNPEDFAQIAFIGKGLHNYSANWLR